MEHPSKEQIKAWLKAHNRDRSWLAEQLGKKLQTVNNWLSSAKPIPDVTLNLISRMMADDDAEEARRKAQQHPLNQLYSIEVDLPTFRLYSRAAAEQRQTVEEWSIATLNAAAEEFHRTGLMPDIRETKSTVAGVSVRILGAGLNAEKISLNEQPAKYLPEVVPNNELSNRA